MTIHAHTYVYIYIYVPLIFIYNFIHIYTCAYFYNMHTCFEDQSIRGVSPSSTGARRNRLLDSSDYRRRDVENHALSNGMVY